MRIIVFETPGEKSIGLQNKPWVEDQTIFVFPGVYEGDVFHSRNVPEAFDIAFIGEDRKILDVQTMSPPADRIAAPKGSAMAIETKGGRCAIWGILPGETFALL